MANSDLAAVKEQYARLSTRKAELEQKRAVLLEEDEELALTEKVLVRLGDELAPAQPAEPQRREEYYAQATTPVSSPTRWTKAAISAARSMRSRWAYIRGGH